MPIWFTCILLIIRYVLYIYNIRYQDVMSTLVKRQRSQGSKEKLLRIDTLNESLLG